MRKTNKFLALSLVLALLATVLPAPLTLAEENSGTGQTVTTTTETSSGSTADETPTVTTTSATDENDDDETDETETSTAKASELETEIDENADAIDENAEDLTSEDDTEIDAAIAEIEADVAEMEADLTEADGDGYEVALHRNTLAKIKILLVRIKMAHKIHNKGELVSLQKQLRNLISSLKKAEIKAKLKHEIRQNRREKVKDLDLNAVLLSVRWGQIKPIASGATVTDEDWSGELSVTNGKIKLVSPILFEDNDEITAEETTKITFDSTIKTHFDGLLIKVFPAEDGTYAETTLTVNFEKQTDLTYTKADFQAGKYKELVDADGQGVVIEKRIAGRIADGILANFREEHRAEIEDLLENIDDESQDEISGLLQEVDADTQADFVQKRQKFGKKFDQFVKHLAFVPQAKREALLEQKLAVLAEAENLDELIAEMNLPAEAKALLEEVLALIEEYNFDPLTAVKLNKRLQIFIAKAEQAGLTAEEIEAEIAKLKAEAEAFQAEAKGQKFTQGLIPFKDTDDTDWFTQYVSYVKNKSIVGGYKDGNGRELGEFRPANNVTVAEVLKMSLESAGIGKATSGDSLNAKVAEHWAELYFVQAESLGLTLVADTTVDPSRLATRGEVIRLILEVLGIEPDAVTSTDFSDVPATDANAAYIQYAKQAGVISGDANQNTFRPNDPINRAEVAKILKNMIEILKSAVDVN